MHTIAHILKQVSSRYDVQLISPAPPKLVVLCFEKLTCRAVMKGARDATRDIKHVKKYFECKLKKFVEFLCPAGHSTLDRRASAFTKGLRNTRVYAVEMQSRGILLSTALPVNATWISIILAYSKNKIKRIIVEASCMLLGKLSAYVSFPSTAFTDREVEFLENKDHFN